MTLYFFMFSSTAVILYTKYPCASVNSASLTKEFAPTLVCAVFIASIMLTVTLDLKASPIVDFTSIVPVQFTLSCISDVALVVVVVALVVPAISCAEILDIPVIPIADIIPTIIPNKIFLETSYFILFWLMSFFDIKHKWYNIF